MKNLYTLTMVIFITLSAFTQSPQKMSYQAVIRNSSGVLVTTHAVGMKISILQGSVSGTVVFSETYSPTPQTNANGLVSIEIGSGLPLTGTFTGIDWANGPYFIKTETDPTGGTSYTITGTSQLLSVPYALYSRTAQTADYNSLSNLPTLNITNWNTAFGWGNHTGLYRSNSWVPAWTDVAGKPNFATVATSGSYNDLANKPILINSQWTTSGSNIYYNLGNVGIGTSSPSTYIHAHGVPVTSRGQLSLSSPAGQDIFLSFYEANTFKAYLWYSVADQDLRLQNFTAGDLNLNPYGGKVGIGTNAPSATLEVAGQIKITGGNPSAGSVLTSDGTGLAVWQAPTGGLGGSGNTNTIPLFTSANTLGNSNINYTTTWGGSIGIGASPDAMQTKFLVQYFWPIGSNPLPYIARFQTKAATIPAIITDLAYIKGNGEAFFQGPVIIGPNSETVIENDGNAYFDKSLTVGQMTVGPTGSNIAEIRSFTGTLPNNPEKWDDHWDYKIDLPGTNTWTSNKWCILSIEIDYNGNSWWTPYTNGNPLFFSHSGQRVSFSMPTSDFWFGHTYRIVVMRFQ